MWVALVLNGKVDLEEGDLRPPQNLVPPVMSKQAQREIHHRRTGRGNEETIATAATNVTRKGRAIALQGW